MEPRAKHYNKLRHGISEARTLKNSVGFLQRYLDCLRGGIHGEVKPAVWAAEVMWEPLVCPWALA